MGSGKTFLAISAAEHFKEEKIVICPYSILPTWKIEFQKYGQLTTKYNMYSYESYKKFSKINFKDKILILDEAHEFVNLQKLLN